MIRFTSIKMQCKESLNDSCKTQCSEALLRLKSNAMLPLNERV